MASVVDICNLGLSHLGDEATVVAISPPDGSVQAAHCARFYPIARDALLEMHLWRFNTKRVVLAEIDNPVDSWVYAYAYPSECLRPAAVLFPEATDDSDTQDFVVETLEDGSQVIYTNVPQATLLYAARTTDTTKYTPLFVVAVARLLSSYLAGPIYKGETGMKIAQAQLSIFTNVDFPRAAVADANARKSNAYKDFTPGGIASRA